jgi:hypothetical protein
MLIAEHSQTSILVGVDCSRKWDHERNKAAMRAINGRPPPIHLLSLCFSYYFIVIPKIPRYLQT